jgi:hypothetical protein
LDAAGYHPPAEEVAELESEYAVLRQMVQMLHAVESARYESPALIFDPDPEFVDWAHESAARVPGQALDSSHARCFAATSWELSSP